MFSLWDQFKEIFFRRVSVKVIPKTFPDPYFPTEQEHFAAYGRYLDEDPDNKDISYSEFKVRYGTCLIEEHCGDCICVPSTCMRCYAEDLYAIKSTVTWCKCYYYANDSDKHEEHRGIFVM